MQAISEYCSLSSRAGLTCVSLCFFDCHRDQLPLLALLTFGPSARGVPTMASADFWLSIAAPLGATSTQADRQISPGMTHPPSRLCPSDLRRIVPCKYWALTILAASPRYAAFYPLRVPRTSALPAASFRSHLAVGTLAVRLTLPLAGCVEDFHLQVRAPCRAHQKKARRKRAQQGVWFNGDMKPSSPPFDTGSKVRLKKRQHVVRQRHDTGDTPASNREPLPHE